MDPFTTISQDAGKLGFVVVAFNLLDVRDRLELVDRDVRITDGVTVHLLGGHSPGTQVVLLDTADGRVCIPGDLVPFYQNIELNWPMVPSLTSRASPRLRLDADAR
jgi:glyoxylase-like metal-dependent hydrolase (beta-lactamase superfamily II)